MARLASDMRQEQVTLPTHVIDLAEDELRSAAGERVILRPRSLAVLRLLAENAGRLVHKDEILTQVWGDVVVTDDSLTQCISDIREAIGDHDRRVVRTIPRRGYVLVPSQRALAGTPGRPVIAVRPFNSLTGAKGESLAIGVATELVNELARNRDLKVIGRDSSFALGSQPATAQELGGRLGAQYLVEGTAQRFKDTLLVDVQLVDSRSGLIAWGDRFSARAAEIPRVQRLIATRIAGTLRVTMREAEKQTALGRAPQDLGAYELTLRGMSKHRFTPEATRAAREDYEEAIRRDPNYALAWTYLAWTNMIDVWAQLTGEWPPFRIDEVVDQFRRAIELDPNLAKAHSGLGRAMLTKDCVAEALEITRRAVELAPSDPDALLSYGMALFQSGDLSGATSAVDQALELHPLRPSYYCYFHAMILWGSKRFKEALDEADECLRKAPKFAAAEVYRTLALVGVGRIAEAKAQLKEHQSRTPRPPVPPHPPELASRFLADLKTAGWRPTVAVDRKAV